MKLILVESPTKTKTLEKFLGKEYKVLASFGHLRDLPRSEIGIDIEKNFEPKYVIPRKMRRHIKPLTEAAVKAEKIYLATDPDREGEAISYHLLSALGIKDYERITFNEITQEAVKNAINSPRKIDMDLVNAQQARRVLDRLVGYKLSPFLWKKLFYGLSAGRVQSVALRLITDREKEIEGFIKKEYWSISALVSSKNGNFPAQLKKIDKKTISKFDIENEEQAEHIKIDISTANLKIEDIIRKEKKRNPLPPFTTSTMQQEAFKKLKFSSKFTMIIAQSLYEKGLITYHRTDSLHIAQSAEQSANSFIIESFGKDYADPKKFAAKGKTQEAHEAIRPSMVEKTPDTVTKIKDPETKLYRLIWSRFIASQMSSAVFDSTSISISAKNKKNYTLVASGSVLLFDGFLKVYQMKFEETELPLVEKEDALDLEKVFTEQHFTAPPARFTEATLIKELEKNGVGRPSTYAPTIATIAERNYTEKVDRKYLKPTETGRIVSDLLIEHFSNIVDFKFTANMEKNLDTIAHGKANWRDVIGDFYKDFAENLSKKELEVKKENIMKEKIEEKCEKCGHEMAVKLGRFGKFIACTNFPECKNTKQLDDKNGDEESPEVEEKNHPPIKCDKWNGEMKVKKSRFGEFYGCENYPQCKNTKALEGDLDIKCPECKEGDVVKKSSRRGPFYACSKYPDCKFTSSTKPE